MPEKHLDLRPLDENHASDLPWDDADLWDEDLSDEADDEAEAKDEAKDDEAAVRSWWAQLPDCIKPDYPFDLPPDRLPGARYVFTLAGAPQHCPQLSCRRGKECRGGDGPPCFRADRRDLGQVLFLWWMMLYHGCTDQEYASALRARGNRYAPPEKPPAAGHRARPRRRR